MQPFAPGVVGQPPGQAGATLPPCYNSGFESVMAAVSRGEVSLNTVIAGNNQHGGVNNANNMAGNPTLLQAISQGPVGQNGTNGLGTSGAYGGTINSGSAGGVSVATANFGPSTAFGGTQTIDAKQVMSVPALTNPIQYGGA